MRGRGREEGGKGGMGGKGERHRGEGKDGRECARGEEEGRMVCVLQ